MYSEHVDYIHIVSLYPPVQWPVELYHYNFIFGDLHLNVAVINIEGLIVSSLTLLYFQVDFRVN